MFLILHSHFKEEIPLLVLSQAADSDEEPCSPPPILFCPVRNFFGGLRSSRPKVIWLEVTSPEVISGDVI